MSEVKQNLRRFLEEDSFYQDSIKRGFADDFPLMDSGALDSLGILNLLVFIETRFLITVGIEDLSEANFATLSKIEKFVQSKTVPKHGS